MSKFRDPIDYDQTITDVTKNICDYYKCKIAREAHKMSKEQYDKLVDMHKQFEEKSGQDCFYEKSAWNTYDEMLKLSDMHTFVVSFFESAKAYRDAKAAGKDTINAEKNLADAAKKVNIRAKTHSSVAAGLLGNMNVIVPSWLFATHVKGASK